jgi:biotin carboxyl carrier protein
MRVTLERDGKTTTVEVTPSLDAVTVGTETYPVTVVRADALTVELEIAGEKVVIENWPDHFPEPPGPVDVNGERWTVGLFRGPAATVPSVVAKGGSLPPEVSPASPTPPPAGGIPIVPSMPGKVIEVRVKEGERVRKGDVLLVLEAMKMRNELTSPADGVVRGLRVSAGGNARAREPMMFIAPD